MTHTERDRGARDDRDAAIIAGTMLVLQVILLLSTMLWP